MLSKNFVYCHSLAFMLREYQGQRGQNFPSYSTASIDINQLLNYNFRNRMYFIPTIMCIQDKTPRYFYMSPYRRHCNLIDISFADIANFYLSYIIYANSFNNKLSFFI